MLRSSLKELDDGLFSKEDLIHKQNGKMAEKDRVIQSQKADMERLEKKTKMQEYKVRSQAIHKYSQQPHSCAVVCSSVKCKAINQLY